MKGVTKHIKLHLHHRRHADVIAFIKTIDRGDFAQTVIEGLRMVAQSEGVQLARPVSRASDSVGKSVVMLDESEGFT